ncbi:MAG: hypothetical protein F6K11_19950 [Leptolyngbya sp. SIO3F4]|nr:hypothetical protein [Leptolyngbya sp. SIO3F4]
MTPITQTSPLQRIQVNDGMLITADHWQIAHSYHQQRQAIYYEALHQSGIVSGLGVNVGPVPETAPSKYRQPRWLTIQPGLAMDNKGNPILVANAESCYLSAQPVTETTIYIVLKHSEQASQSAIVQEAFQILEKDVPAEADEVELCRVRLGVGEVSIAPPDDVFAPTLNQLDLRHRQRVRPRSQLTASVSAWSHRSPIIAQFEALFATLPGLYPSLLGKVRTEALQSDLTHFSYEEFCQLQHPDQHQVAEYLQQGGVVLVETVSAQLSDLYQAETELRSALAASRRDSSTSLHLSAEKELTEIQACITEAVTELTEPLLSFMHAEELEFKPLAMDYVLRLQPFSFSRLPTLNGRPIGLYGWEGLLLLIGPLPQAWYVNENVDLPREEIRSAQELGVNLLNFAAQRRRMHQWLKPLTSHA